MNRLPMHPTDEEIIRAVDGELAIREKARLLRHLEQCWTCRERMDSFQQAISAFVRAHHETLDAQIPSIAGPRALLRARMNETADGTNAPAPKPGWRQAVATATVFPLIVVLILVFQAAVNADGPSPQSGITPGETRPITLAEVCRQPDAEVIRHDIPEDLKLQVFAAYGVKSSQADQYEVDYLITPDLGGTSSLRNLWPQAYSPRWNARKKDLLEQQLHTLVCRGELDLATAQRDIAADWIAAYKKYMSANKSR